MRGRARSGKGSLGLSRGTLFRRMISHLMRVRNLISSQSRIRLSAFPALTSNRRVLPPHGKVCGRRTERESPSLLQRPECDQAEGSGEDETRVGGQKREKQEKLHLCMVCDADWQAKTDGMSRQEMMADAAIALELMKTIVARGVDACYPSPQFGRAALRLFFRAT